MVSIRTIAYTPPRRLQIQVEQVLRAEKSDMTNREGPAIRRVVTGHDGEGRSVVVLDELAQGDVTTQVWQAPPDSNNIDDFEAGRQQPGHTVPKGSALRYADLHPGYRSEMHRTGTVDYVIILEGELEMELDSGEWVHLRQGDVVVQRGTMHAWENKSDRVCRMAAILIGAQNVVVNGRVIEPNWK